MYQAKGTLTFPLGPAKHPLKRKVRRDGKEAVTHYQVLKRNEDMTLIEVKLHTGRTHQIRVHFAHIRHPLLGDTRYGRGEHPHLYLCAKSLGFTHPHSKQWVEFQIDYPPHFKQLIAHFNR